MNIPSINFYDLAGIFTPMMLGLLCLFGLILDGWLGKKKPNWVGGYAFVGVIMILIFQALLHLYRANLKGDIGAGFGGSFYFDLFGIYFNYLFLAGAILVLAMSFSHLADKKYHRGEYYLLLLIATAGMCLLAGARDLIVAFLGLETMSLSVYALAGADRENPKSNEAGLKYLLLGAFASAILLYGIALLYGAGGALDFPALSRNLNQLTGKDQRFYFMLAGIALVIVGFGFKIATVPFHIWVPDVYEGAPTPITAYMAGGVKAAGFAILVRVFLFTFSGEWVPCYKILWAFAVLTMTVGNLIALVQTNIKRLLAYSSIAHAGYLLVGFTALVASKNITEAFAPTYAIMYYLLVYLFMTIGAFAVVVFLGREGRGGEELDDYAGLAKTRPFLAGAMAVFMFSLAGVPPFGGFFAKFYIFQTAVVHRLYILTIIAVLNSVIAAFYYLRVIYVMYMQEAREKLVEPGYESGVLLTSVIIFSLFMVFITGLAPSRFWEIIELTFLRGIV